MNLVDEKFFTRAISFKPETCEAVKAALDASFGAFGRDFEVDGWLRF